MKIVYNLIINGLNYSKAGKNLATKNFVTLSFWLNLKYNI